MTHWRISNGHIEVMDDHKDDYPNLMTTVDFYKHRLREQKEQFEALSQDDRKFSEVTAEDGTLWKQFTPETREDIYKLAGESTKPTFEDTMTVDTIKAMRRDRRH